jgi:hypothetical protein
VLTAPSVLNGVAWSAVLDETFRKNFEDDATLSWQYFASQSGFLRNFPGKLCSEFGAYIITRLLRNGDFVTVPMLRLTDTICKSCQFIRA